MLKTGKTNGYFISLNGFFLNMGEWDKLLRHEDYTVHINGVDIFVQDKVFTPDPAITNSTAILLNTIPDIKGKTVLDMGTGTGIIAIYCALKGAKKVVACDVDPLAIENAKKNVKKYDFEEQIELIKSDLFENVEGKFDYILANLPILDEVWATAELTENIIARYLRASREHIKKGGKVYFTWASFVDIVPVQAFCNELGYNFRIITEHEGDYDWYVFEISY